MHSKVQNLILIDSVNATYTNQKIWICMFFTNVFVLSITGVELNANRSSAINPMKMESS